MATCAISATEANVIPAAGAKGRDDSQINLVKRAQAGDEQAFAITVRCEEDKIIRAAIDHVAERWVEGNMTASVRQFRRAEIFHRRLALAWRVGDDTLCYVSAGDAPADASPGGENLTGDPDIA